jgi:hypothetical protein
MESEKQTGLNKEMDEAMDKILKKMEANKSA